MSGNIFKSCNVFHFEKIRNGGRISLRMAIVL